MADASGVFEGLETGRDGFPRVVTEVEVTRARGDDQRVVGNRALIEDDAAPGGIEIDGIGEQNLCVFLLAQQDPQRRRDFAWRQRTRGDLVQQGLEEVKVPAVDQRDGEIFVPQGPCGVEPAETPADDDGAMHT